VRGSVSGLALHRGAHRRHHRHHHRVRAAPRPHVGALTLLSVMSTAVHRGELADGSASSTTRPAAHAFPVALCLTEPASFRRGRGTSGSGGSSGTQRFPLCPLDSSPFWRLMQAERQPVALDEPWQQPGRRRRQPAWRSGARKVKVHAQGAGARQPRAAGPARGRQPRGLPGDYRAPKVAVRWARFGRCCKPQEWHAFLRAISLMQALPNEALLNPEHAVHRSLKALRRFCNARSSRVTTTQVLDC